MERTVALVLSSVNSNVRELAVALTFAVIMLSLAATGGWCDEPGAADLPETGQASWLRDNYPAVTHPLSRLPDGEYICHRDYVSGISRTFTFWKRGDHLRLDRIDKAPKAAHLVTIAQGTTLVNLLNPQDVPQVTAHRRNSDLADLQFDVDLDLLVLTAAWSYFEVPIANFIHDPGFEVDSLAIAEREGRPLLKVEWTCRQKDVFAQYGWFLFDRSKGWRLHEFARGKLANRAKAEYLLGRRMTYQGDSMIPTKVEEGRLSIDGETLTPDFSVSTVKADPATPAAEVFEVTQFGLPDLFAAQPPEPRSLWRWWLVGGAALAAAVWWFIRRERRRSTL